MQNSLFVLIGAALGVGMHRGLFIHGEWHLQAPLILLSHLTVCFTGLVTGISLGWIVVTSCYVVALFGSVIIYRQYGDSVRTGLSEITVFRPDVFMAVGAPLSTCTKAERYDFTALADEYGTAALPLYQAQILHLIDQLDHCILSDIKHDRVSEATDLFYWLSFDRMGELALHRSFNMLSNQKYHHFIVLLQRAISILGPLGPTPWLIHIAFRLLPRAWILKDWFTMMAWCESELRKQMTMPASASENPDVVYHLIQDAKDDKTQESWLAGDSILAVVAGSEPTAEALCALFYELAKNPDQMDIIHHELKDQKVDPSVYPAVPSEGNRKTSAKEGITVGGVYIPPETTIVTPRFPIGRREDCFTQANKFIPERWTTRPEMVRFALGDDGTSVWGDWRDQFTSNLGRLRLVFEERTA
ncbi:cytochrome P450 [Aspergillus multicolor]|uniref:cytochrome P450 n=1 Tax=Aspergillus multicolor TaxID=41759 RepID=UPI003CCE29DE